MSQSVEVRTNDGRTIVSNNGSIVMQKIAGLYIRARQLFNRAGNLYNRPSTQRYNRK